MYTIRAFNENDLDAARTSFIELLAEVQ